MQSTRTPPPAPASGTKPVRTTVGWITLAIAMALTALIALMLYDYATTDYIGGEVEAARFILGFVAIITTVAWLVGIALIRIGRRPNP